MLRLLAEFMGISGTACDLIALEIVEDTPYLFAKSLWWWMSGGTVEWHVVNCWWADGITYRVFKWIPR